MLVRRLHPLGVWVNLLRPLCKLPNKQPCQSISSCSRNFLSKTPRKNLSSIFKLSTRHASNHPTRSNDKPFLVTTPIFYVNADPHIGHLHSAVTADTLARYHRLNGRKVSFSTGTDEHGLKIQQAAASKEMDPRKFCDAVSMRFKDLFEAADIQYTDFIRTTEPRHERTVEEFWNRLVEGGYIYKEHYEGWYSISDETFILPSNLRTEIDPTTGKERTVSIQSEEVLEWATEENYKFRLSLFSEKLKNWLLTNPNAIIPVDRYQEVLSSLNEPLSDLSVSRSRDRLRWGISVPGDPTQVIYVWLDALVNYLTISGWPHNQPENANPWPADVHVVGKDILRFHAIFWPAFLMANSIPLPKRIIAHAHWTTNHVKMSKSKGNVVDPFAEMAKFGPEIVRFFLMRDGKLAADTNYCEDVLISRYDKDLKTQLGNLLSRSTSKLINPSQLVPQRVDTAGDASSIEFENVLEQMPDLVHAQLQEGDIQKALDEIFEVISVANRYFQQAQPWKLVKGTTPELQKQHGISIYLISECLRMTGLFLQPIMPQTMDQLLNRLGVPVEERDLKFARLHAGDRGRREIGESIVLFPKLNLSTTDVAGETGSKKKR